MQPAAEYRVAWNRYSEARKRQLADARKIVRMPCLACTLHRPCVAGVCMACRNNPQILTDLKEIASGIEARLDAAVTTLREAERAANEDELAAFTRMLGANQSAPDYRERLRKALAHQSGFGTLVRAYVAYQQLGKEVQRLVDLAAASHVLEAEKEGNKDE